MSMADDLIEQGMLQKALHDSGGDCGYGCPYCEDEYREERGLEDDNK